MDRISLKRGCASFAVHSSSRISPSGLLEKRRQLIIDSLQMLRDNLGLGEDGHEIMIPVPARHDVIVHMPRYTGASRATKVDADVVALRIHRPPKTTNRLAERQHEVGQLVRDETIEIGGVGIGHDHQMAGVIGKLVKDDESSSTTPEDEIVTIGLCTRKRAENTSVWRLILGL